MILRQCRPVFRRSLLVFVLLLVLTSVYGAIIPKANHVDPTDQTTLLDGVAMRAVFRFLRTWMFNVVGRTGERTSGSFLQDRVPPEVPFPCNVSLGRSPRVPTSVHKLRPGDINVIAAMGDSLTAATGASASGFFDLYMENRGLAWSIGGQWDWRNVTTLPNILKVFNPKVGQWV
ncbi:phospholipase b, plb1 [Anopheles sinensis]|uniref:Phospholipase b, plb1 n=1 Tax=Anopheles sinensis TaxID=74873 RepID=A0A084VXB1_ANOSI|nr:phospholipase b, plb1 [Anopheles sinensis]